MKKTILLMVCMGAVFCSLAQETPSEKANPVLTKEEYLKKSKGQRTGAIVLVSAGGAMAIAGLGILLNDAANDIADDYVNGIYTDPNGPVTSKKHTAIAAVLIVAGLGVVAGGISLFRSAHKNKVRGLALSFENELVPQLQRGMAFSRWVPSLTLKINL